MAESSPVLGGSCRFYSRAWFNYRSLRVVKGFALPLVACICKSGGD